MGYTPPGQPPKKEEPKLPDPVYQATVKPDCPFNQVRAGGDSYIKGAWRPVPYGDGKEVGAHKYLVMIGIDDDPPDLTPIEPIKMGVYDCEYCGGSATLENDGVHGCPGCGAAMIRRRQVVIKENRKLTQSELANIVQGIEQYLNHGGIMVVPSFIEVYVDGVRLDSNADPELEPPVEPVQQRTPGNTEHLNFSASRRPAPTQKPSTSKK